MSNPFSTTVNKAVTGGFTSAAAAFAVAYSDSVITQSEWLTIGGAFLVGFGGVWATKNAAATPDPAQSPYVPDIVANAADPGATA